MRYSLSRVSPASRHRALIPLLLLSLCACTTPPPRPVTPRIPDPPAPAECRKDAFQAFSDELTGLPPAWLSLSREDRMKLLLLNKAIDTTNYRLLRAQAIRCAPAR